MTRNHIYLAQLFSEVFQSELSVQPLAAAAISILESRNQQ